MLYRPTLGRITAAPSDQVGAIGASSGKCLRDSIGNCERIARVVAENSTHLPTRYQHVLVKWQDVEAIHRQVMTGIIRAPPIVVIKVERIGKGRAAVH